jgi:hypothetical protein
MAEKVSDFERLLKDLSSRVGEEDATQIRALLEQVRARIGPTLDFNVNVCRMCQRRQMMRPPK